MSQKTINIILVSLLVVALFIGGYALFKPAPTPSPTPSPTPDPKGGLGGAFGDILGQIFTGGWFKNLFSGKSDYEKNNCDPDKKGYNKNGVLDPSCGGGSGSCDPFACDPNKLGFNMCGDKGFPCTCGSGSPQALC